MLVSLALVGMLTALGALHLALNINREQQENRPLTPEELDFQKKMTSLGWDMGVKPVVSDTEDSQSDSDVLSATVGHWVSAMLVLGLAFAIGDGVRSRRAHLHTLEKRASDLEREQHQRVALAMAAERARITRELHDVVAHGLSVMVVQAQGGRAALRRHPDNTASALENIITTGRTSLAEMRRLLTLVRRDPADDPQLVPQPGVAALPELIDRVRGSGMPVEFAVEGDPVPLTMGVDLAAYRVVQEALTNTIAHAGEGASATVVLRYAPGELAIEVSDDGVGGPPEHDDGEGNGPSGHDGRGNGPSGHDGRGNGLRGHDDGEGNGLRGHDGRGNGLRGIGERVGILHGEFSAGPSPTGGFKVSVRLPLSPQGDRLSNEGDRLFPQGDR